MKNKSRRALYVVLAVLLISVVAVTSATYAKYVKDLGAIYSFNVDVMPGDRYLPGADIFRSRIETAITEANQGNLTRIVFGKWYDGTGYVNNTYGTTIADAEWDNGKDIDNYGAVKVFIEPNEIGGATAYVLSESDIYAPPNASYMFAGDSSSKKDQVAYSQFYHNLKEVVMDNFLLPSGTFNMTKMYHHCKSIQRVDLSGWNMENTSRIIVEDAFWGASTLNYLSLANWNFTKVDKNLTPFTYVGFTSQIKTFDISNTTWNSESDSPQLNILNSLTNVTEIIMTGINTDDVTSMAQMFKGLTKLQKITGLEDLDTSNVTTMQGMFQQCRALGNIDITGFDMQNVSNIAQMFYYCSSMTKIEFPTVTNKISSLYWLFYMCGRLNTLDVSKIDTSNVTNIEKLFDTCSSLQTVDLSSWNTGKVTNMKEAFSNCGLRTVYVGSGWSTAKVTNYSNMFWRNGTRVLTGRLGTKGTGNSDLHLARVDAIGHPGVFTVKEDYNARPYADVVIPSYVQQGTLSTFLAGETIDAAALRTAATNEMPTGYALYGWWIDDGIANAIVLDKDLSTNLTKIARDTTRTKQIQPLFYPASTVTATFTNVTITGATKALVTDAATTVTLQNGVAQAFRSYDDIVLTLKAAEKYKLPETIAVTVNETTYAVNTVSGTSSPDGITFADNVLTIPASLLNPGYTVTVTLDAVSTEFEVEVTANLTDVTLTGPTDGKISTYSGSTVEMILTPKDAGYKWDENITLVIGETTYTIATADGTVTGAEDVTGITFDPTTGKLSVKADLLEKSNKAMTLTASATSTWFDVIVDTTGVIEGLTIGGTDNIRTYPGQTIELTFALTEGYSMPQNFTVKLGETEYIVDTTTGKATIGETEESGITFVDGKLTISSDLLKDNPSVVLSVQTVSNWFDVNVSVTDTNATVSETSVRTYPGKDVSLTVTPVDGYTMPESFSVIIGESTYTVTISSSTSSPEGIIFNSGTLTIGAALLSKDVPVTIEITCVPVVSNIAVGDLSNADAGQMQGDTPLDEGAASSTSTGTVTSSDDILTEQPSVDSFTFGEDSSDKKDEEIQNSTPIIEELALLTTGDSDFVLTSTSTITLNNADILLFKGNEYLEGFDLRITGIETNGGEYYASMQTLTENLSLCLSITDNVQNGYLKIIIGESEYYTVQITTGAYIRLDIVAPVGAEIRFEAYEGVPVADILYGDNLKDDTDGNNPLLDHTWLISQQTRTPVQAEQPIDTPTEEPAPTEETPATEQPTEETSEPEDTTSDGEDNGGEQPTENPAPTGDDIPTDPSATE